MARSKEPHLRNMLASIALVRRFTAGQTQETFHADVLLQDALVRRLEIIGEAATRVSREIRERYPEIPWRSMIGFRNVVVHSYFAIDLDIAWRTASAQMATLGPAMRAILDQEFPPSGRDSSPGSTSR